MVWILKIRRAGEETDVFLFRKKEDAERKVFSYFGLYSVFPLSLEKAEQYLFDFEIGYFEIYKGEIK